jgi:hypothetical protein
MGQMSRGVTWIRVIISRFSGTDLLHGFVDRLGKFMKVSLERGFEM